MHDCSPLNFLLIKFLASWESDNHVVMNYATVFRVIEYADLYILRFGADRRLNKMAHVATLVESKQGESCSHYRIIIREEVPCDGDDYHVVIKESVRKPILSPAPRPDTRWIV